MIPFRINHTIAIPIATKTLPAPPPILLRPPRRGRRPQAHSLRLRSDYLVRDTGVSLLHKSHRDLFTFFPVEEVPYHHLHHYWIRRARIINRPEIITLLASKRSVVPSHNTVKYPILSDSFAGNSNCRCGNGVTSFPGKNLV